MFAYINRVALHRITMVLRRDIASSCLPVINSVIGAAVTVFELDGLSAVGKGGQLMP